ncbi:hypothetical protein HMPREF3206_01021 [Fusobacterium equinum]|uniref:Uncharacterized protein n=1 Tax=Fusobacterium equinum TaxID=134605 RepID=A0A133NDJ9_9FUSO|nr:hypothetical protein HMPREF3206_01021 [Fusobacterium equinum]
MFLLKFYQDYISSYYKALFTFQCVSIKVHMQNYSVEMTYYLHFNVFLLKLNAYLLSLFQFPNLHFNVFLLKFGDALAPLIEGTLFTFQCVSIKVYISCISYFLICFLYISMCFY